MPRRPASPRKKPPAFKLPRYIAVEGPIRVGKSSLARILAERMHAKRIMDCDEGNPFLADFYGEKTGAAFSAQMYFLNERYQRLREAFAAEPSGAVVADFIFEKDKIFAYLNLGNEELKLYERFFARFAAEVRPPELVIYLQATPEVLRERVAKKAAARNPASLSNTSRRWCAPTSTFSSATRPPTCSSSTPLKSISSGATRTCSSSCSAWRSR